MRMSGLPRSKILSRPSYLGWLRNRREYPRACPLLKPSSLGLLNPDLREHAVHRKGAAKPRRTPWARVGPMDGQRSRLAGRRHRAGAGIGVVLIAQDTPCRSVNAGRATKERAKRSTAHAIGVQRSVVDVLDGSSLAEHD